MDASITKGTIGDDSLQVCGGGSAGGGHGDGAGHERAGVQFARFQFGVVQISPTTNGLISFAQLDAADRQIQQLESESAGPRGELLEIDQQIAAIDTQVQSAQA